MKIQIKKKKKKKQNKKLSTISNKFTIDMGMMINKQPCNIMINCILNRFMDKLEKNINEILDELLSGNFEDLEGNETISILQRKHNKASEGFIGHR